MRLYQNPSDACIQVLCKRPSLKVGKLNDFLETVFTDVGSAGDKALLSYTKQFDGAVLNKVDLTKPEIEQLATKTTPELAVAIDIAYLNIRAFHKVQELDNLIEMVETMPGVLCWRESRPIERVGLYVPGGTAPLISTVLMLGVPAQIAGCKEIVLCTPPNIDGSIEPAICYASLKVGVTKLVRVGGAQAVAALAIGTKSVPKVDKIFGPGNQYVTGAKKYAVNYGVAIDMPAGPSEVMVLVDESANPAFVAADLLSQAEHGPDSQVVLITTDKKMSVRVNTEIRMQLATLPRKNIASQALSNSFCVFFDTVDQAINFANMYAPEHIILSIKKADKYAASITNAGSVFLGNYSPESAGDYASGTNHTLPTSGWAKSYGGVSLDSFVKKVTFQKLSKSGLTALAPTIKRLAEAEGLMAHARAVAIRLENK